MRIHCIELLTYKRLSHLINSLIAKKIDKMLTFEEIVEKAKNFSKKPTTEDFLEFYGYYKQATCGDCNTDEPEDPIKKAMWQAWKDKQGLTVDDAKAYYIKVYEKYAPKYE